MLIKRHNLIVIYKMGLSLVSHCKIAKIKN